MKKLILGSSSESRLSLLKRIHFFPSKIMFPDIDETPLKKEIPKHLAIRLAKTKALALFDKVKTEKNVVLLTADTVTCIGRRILDKALTDKDVEDRMNLLSGKNCRVYSSFCIIDVSSENIDECKIILKCTETRIKFKVLTLRDINEMIISKSGINKSGGWSIEGFAESLVVRISGCLSTVIGFSTYCVRNSLMSLNVENTVPKNNGAI